MNRRTLLSRLSAVAAMVAAVPLLRLFPSVKAATPKAIRVFSGTEQGYRHAWDNNNYGEPLCGTDDPIPLMCNPHGGIIDCSECHTAIHRRSCASAHSHVIETFEALNAQKTLHYVVHVDPKGKVRGRCHVRKVWCGDGRLSDKEALRALRDGEIVYSPDGTQIYKITGFDWRAREAAVDSKDANSWLVQGPAKAV